MSSDWEAKVRVKASDYIVENATHVIDDDNNSALLKCAALQPDDTLLELASGFGFLGMRIMQEFPTISYTAIDNDKDVIYYHRLRLETTGKSSDEMEHMLHVADIKDLDSLHSIRDARSPAGFSVIICQWFLHLLPQQEQVALVSSWARDLLADGGRIIFTTFPYSRVTYGLHFYEVNQQEEDSMLYDIRSAFPELSCRRKRLANPDDEYRVAEFGGSIATSVKTVCSRILTVATSVHPLSDNDKKAYIENKAGSAHTSPIMISDDRESAISAIADELNDDLNPHGRFVSQKPLQAIVEVHSR